MLSEQTGESLVMAAATLAIALARGRTVEELDVIVAFLTCVADNMALFAGQIPPANDL